MRTLIPALILLALIGLAYLWFGFRRSRIVRPTEAEVEAAVEDWHRGCGCGGLLHEYLGWSWEEYAAWVANPARIPARPLAHGRG